MNKIYRVLWSKTAQAFVAVAEIAKSSRKGCRRSSLITSCTQGTLAAAQQALWAAMACAGLSWSAAFAQAVSPTQLPTGGQVTAGIAKIAQSNATLSITQSSNRAAINWQSFNVGSQAKVSIAQPSSSSVLLNRIQGNSASQIFGQITANGQVIMSNPAGMYFSPTAAVDVSSFTATTHGIQDADFMAGNMKYSRNGATGRIINEGNITAGLGGYVALLAPEVRNNGVIVAKLGTVALASGETFELEFDKQSTLTNILVSPSTIAALVDNGAAVQAPGGLIILSAQAAHQLQNGVVKNSGTLQASGLVNQGGTIRLSASQRIVNTGAVLADAAPNSTGNGGTITAIADLTQANSNVDVGGTLSAKGGGQGGDGGFIETSASRVTIQHNARVITLSPKGKTGTWLVDPTDFSIDSGAAAQTSSGIGADTLQNMLANTSVNITTDGLVAGNGDLSVNAGVSWTANTSLSLTAYRHVNVNAAITATDNAAGLNVTAGTSGVINLGANVSTGGQLNFKSNVSLIASNVSLISTAANVSIAGTVSLNSSVAASNLTVSTQTDGNITGAVSGNTKLIKDGAGTLGLKSGNFYTGGTLLAGGKLRLDHASVTATNATNALGPSGVISFSGGALQFTTNNTVDYSARFNASASQQFAFDTNGQNVTLASLPAGSGTLTKSGLGTLTVTDATTRFGNVSVGATLINAGVLTLDVAHPSAIVSQAVISGAGTLNVEPVGISFNNPTMTSTHVLFGTGASTLGAFNLGKTGNAANITLDSMPGMNITGAQGYYGNQVTLASHATSIWTSWNTGATLTLSGMDAVNVLAPISVTGVNSSIAIKTSQNSLAGGNSGYYNFGLGATGFSGRIDFTPAAGQTFTTQDGTNAANLKNYTFITSLAQLRDSSATANLALLSNLDAAAYLLPGVAGQDNGRGVGNPYPYTSIRAGSFTGSFAGLGHTISNLSVRSAGSSYAGMFSQIGAGGVVQDIRFEQANVTGINMNYLGTLSGYANNANISGIMVANGAVNITSSGWWAGGVVGYTEGGVFRDAWVNSNPVSAFSGGAGGILGRSLMSVANVHNLGSDVQSSGQEVGGVIGQHWNGATLSRSDASGNVSGVGSYMGGLVGNNWGNINDSFASGNVQGSGGQIGGAIGRAYGDTTLTNVSVSGTVRNTGGASTGGVVGNATHSVTFNNVSYSGTLVTSAGGSEGVGGLLGYGNSAVTIANSSVGNAGARTNISSTGASGGLVGWVQSGVTITNSNVSNADITGGQYVGGLIGEQRRGTVQINNAFAGGSGNTNISGNNFVGGLVGEMIGGYINNAYYAGNITATSNYGGIVGFLKPGAYLANTFYNVSASLINGNATLTMGGLYGGQFSDWVTSNPSNVSARSLTIGNYFDLDNGYYTLNTNNNVGARNDLSNLMGFSQGLTNGSTNAYRFKLTSHLETATATTKFIPYFAAAEFLGNGFQVNNFSWNAPTSNVGFLGAVHKSTVSGLKVYSTPYELTGNANAVNGQYYVGTAIGSVYAGVLVDSSAVLGGTTKGLDNTGGFIGYFSDGPMGNVSATRLPSVTDASKAQVIGSMTYSVDADLWQDLRGNTGGVAGYVGGSSINQLNANLDVAATGYRTGGLIGFLSIGNYTHASVTANSANNLSATGNVSSTASQTGALIGRASGSATPSTNWTASGNVTATDYLGGLVGHLSSGTFSNLTSTSVNVTSTTAGTSTGGLVGYMNGVTVSNSSSVANVLGAGSYAGGFVGDLEGANSLTNVSASGNVSSTSYYVGGLVGGLNSNSIIRNSRYIGQSVSGVSLVGGLIGMSNSTAAEVYGSYVSTNVTATGDYVGGLMGFFEGKLGDSSNASASAYGSSSNHSYATGNVTGRYDVGGLVGRLGSYGQVTNTYASVNITADANFGGLIGHFSPGVEVTNSHYNMGGITMTAYTPASPSSRVVLNDSNGLLTVGGLYGSQYATWFNAGQLDGLASGGANNAAVYLGAADANGYYRISTPQHIKDYLGFADQSNLKFRLDANLDMSANPGLYVPYVAGELKPDSKTVSNLLLRQNTSNLGFIGYLRNNSTQATAGLSLSDLTVSGSVTGVMNLGLVTGSDWQRNISNVSTSGTVTGTDLYYADKQAPSLDDRAENNNGWSNVGGVLGYAWGRDTGSSNNLLLNNINSSAAVTGVNMVGGMAGNLQYATVSNTTTTGNVTSVEKTNITVYRTGGVVGQLYKTNSLLLNSSHSQGLVKGVNYVGGLVGEMQGQLGETVVNATPTYSTFVSSNVEGKSDRVGGLIGNHAWGTMTNAQMSGTVSGWTVSGVAGYAGSYIGGLGGYVNGNMSYVRYTGTLVKGGSYTGGLAGQNDSTISLASSTGEVMGSGNYVGGLSGYSAQLSTVSSTANVTGGTYTGGLAGQMGGSIVNSSWTGASVHGGHQSGGLVGNLGGTIDNSFATGDVVTSANNVGGLVGSTGNWVRNSYATGNVSGWDTVGGLVGYADWVSNSYATGNVSGAYNVGGFVGNLHQASNSYATGNVSGTANSVGGFVGYARNNIINSWAAGNVNTTSGNGVGGFAGYVAGGTWSNVSASGNVTSNNGSYIGGFVGQNAGGVINSANSTGFVYGSDATTLNYVGGFAGLNQATINGATANISVVNPISTVGVRGSNYVGGFVGDNTGTITNAKSSASVSARNDRVGGFVGYMEAGTISNSGDWGSVMGPSTVGGFAGYQYGGTIQSSFANAVVSAGGSGLTASSSKVGGFVGSMDYGTITNSRAAGSVAGLGMVGGFVGSINNTSTVSNSYATGAVTQTSNSTAGTAGGVGGFAGYLGSNYLGALSDIYAMGAVIGNQNVGGLIGYADRGTITAGYATGMTSFNANITPTPANIGGVLGSFNATAGRVIASNLYWDTTTSNQSVSGGIGVGLSTVQFKGTLSNTVGFNASNTSWNTSAGMYPYLRIFYPTQPRAIEGFAYLSDGTVARRAQVGQYTGGTLLNGGTASTGVNGYFYSIVGSNTLFGDAAIPEGIASVAIDPNNRGSGYNSPTTVSFVGGGGSGATATASLVNPQNVTTSSLYNITVTAPGSGYTSAPQVVLSSSASSPTAPVLNVTLMVPEFNTTQLATLLMLDGNVTVNSTVAGMVYTDRILTDNSASIYKDGNTNVMERLVQGITRLSTQNSSATLMNQDLASTMSAAKQASVAASLPAISSLELFSRSSAFNLNTPLSYADNGVSNAGNITVTGNANVMLSGGTITSTKAQNYMAVLSLGANMTLNATTVTTNSTLAGGGYNLTIGNVSAIDSGNLITGGDFTNLNNVWVTRYSTLNGHVSSLGNQTYNGLVTLGVDTTLTGSNVTLASGANLTGNGHSVDVVGNASLGGDVNGVSTVNVSGTTRLAANVTSTANQTYMGPMNLATNSRLQASGANAVITTQGSINGASSGVQTLTLNATGAGARVVLNGAVGDVTALGSLDANSSSLTLGGGSVRTTGGQSYVGPITLTQNTVLSSTSGAGTISMTGSINSDVAGSRSLNISAAGGGVSLASAVGNITSLSAMEIMAGTILFNGGSVTTSGNQSYVGALTLGADTTLTGSTVTLSSGSTLVGSSHGVDVVGNASLGGDVSGVTTLNVSGTTRLAVNVTSTGDQRYTGAITVAADSRLQATGVNAVITAQGDINGAASGAPALTLNATGTGGRVVLNGAVGTATALGSLNVNANAITLDGGSIRTTGNQAYAGPVTISRDTLLSSSSGVGVISMSDALNGDVAGSRSLTVSNAGGSLSLNRAWGNVNSLNAVDVTAGTMALNGAMVTTSGNQSYSGAVILGADLTLTGSNVTLTGGSSLSGGSHGLDVVGNASLVGDVSGASTVTVSGTTRLAANVTSTGSQTYTGAMTVAANASLQASGANAVLTAHSMVNAMGNGAQALTLNATGSGGRVVLNGVVGNVAALSRLSVNAGAITLGGSSVRTTGSQSFDGPLTLTQNTELSSTSGVGVISLADTINADVASSRSLNISNAGGGVSLGGAVGNTSRLNTVEVTTGTLAFNGGAVTTSGNQTYAGSITLGAGLQLQATGATAVITAQGDINGASSGAPAMTLNATGTGGRVVLNGAVGTAAALGSLNVNASAITLDGGSIRTTGNQAYAGPVTISRDTLLSSSSGVGVISMSDVLNGDVAGSRSLTVSNAGGSVRLNRAWGNVNSLNTVDVTAGTMELNGAEVTTRGNQSYTGAMTLAADARLLASGANATITVQSPVNGLATGVQSMTLNASGSGGRVVMNGAVGSGTSLGQLNITASAITLNTGSVSTTGSQTYHGAVTLGRDLTLTVGQSNSNIAFNGTLDSDGTPRALAVQSGGVNTALSFNSSVGASRALSSITNAAATTVIGDATSHAPIVINVTDVQFSNAVQLQAPLSVYVASSGSLQGVLSGPYDLTKDGVGTLLLSQRNTYTGSTTVSAGTLAISDPQAMGVNTQTVTVAGGAVLDVQGVSVLAKNLTLQGGTLRSTGSDAQWSGRMSLTADSRIDVPTGKFNVSGIVDSGAAGSGLALTGQGSIILSHPGNALSRLASTSGLASLDIYNSVPMTLGTVTTGASNSIGLQGTGPITLASTASVTIPIGASIVSTGGNLVVETSRFINQAGASALSVPAGNRWQIWSTNASPFDASSGDSPNTLANDFVQYNVSRAAAPQVPTGNGLLFSYAPVATASLTGLVSKIYDGTSAAVLTPGHYTVSGAVNQDLLLLNTSQSGQYVSAGTAATVQGAGTSKSIQVAGVTMTASQAGKPVYGYTFSSTVTGTIGDILPKPLDLEMTKVYEGNNLFDNRNAYVLKGMVTGDATPTITSGVATVASPNAGVYNQFVSSSLTLSDANYTLKNAGQLATIDKAPLGIAINALSKGKADLLDLAAKDFVVVGLQNGDIIPKIDVASLLYKEVNRNDDNYVKSIIVSAGPGIANMGNYSITQAVNRAAKPAEGSNTMNMVKLTSPDEVVILPAVPRPYLPEVSKPASAPTPASPASTTAASATTATSSASPSATGAAASAQTAVAQSSVPNAVVATSTPGITVSTITPPSAQTNGLVTVVLPKELSNVAVTGLVIALPQAVVAPAAGVTTAGDTPEPSVMLSNNQPLPDWIRFDPGQKALVTTPDPRASFPISVMITVGDQRTVIVVSESSQN